MLESQVVSTGLQSAIRAQLLIHACSIVMRQRKIGLCCIMHEECQAAHLAKLHALQVPSQQEQNMQISRWATSITCFLPLLSFLLHVSCVRLKKCHSQRPLLAVDRDGETLYTLSAWPAGVANTLVRSKNGAASTECACKWNLIYPCACGRCLIGARSLV